MGAVAAGWDCVRVVSGSAGLRGGPDGCGVGAVCAGSDSCVQRAGVRGVGPKVERGRPATVGPAVGERVCRIAKTPPVELAKPCTVWSLTMLADYLAEGCSTRFSTETIRQILPAARGHHRAVQGVLVRILRHHDESASEDLQRGTDPIGAGQPVQDHRQIRRRVLRQPRKPRHRPGRPRVVLLSTSGSSPRPQSTANWPGRSPNTVCASASLNRG